MISLASWSEFLASGSPTQALPHVTPDDIAQIQYTSGTTGFPKGAQLSHRSLSNNGRFYARAIGAGPDDVWINPMPMFHTAGCGLLTLGALQTGGVHVIPAGFDPAVMLGLFEAERGTIMLSVPTMLIRMLDHPDAATREPVVMAADHAGGRSGAARTGAPRADRVRREGGHRLRADGGVPLYHPHASR